MMSGPALTIAPMLLRDDMLVSEVVRVNPNERVLRSMVVTLSRTDLENKLVELLMGAADAGSTSDASSPPPKPPVVKPDPDEEPDRFTGSTADLDAGIVEAIAELCVEGGPPSRAEILARFERKHEKGFSATQFSFAVRGKDGKPGRLTAKVEQVGGPRGHTRYRIRLPKGEEGL